MSPDCGCTCPHHAIAPMSAQEIAVMQLMLAVFLLTIPALAGIHFWSRARLFPGKMLVLPKVPASPVLAFRRGGVSRHGLALTLPFLLTVLAIIVISHPARHPIDGIWLWLLLSYPFGIYTLVGIRKVIEQMGRDELELDVARGTFRHRTGLPGLVKTRTGKIAALGRLEIKEGDPVSGGRLGYWTVRFFRPAPLHQTFPMPRITLLGGFDNLQDAECLCRQVRLSLGHRRIVFSAGASGQEDRVFVYSPGQQAESLPATISTDTAEEHVPTTAAERNIKIAGGY